VGFHSSFPLLSFSPFSFPHLKGELMKLVTVLIPETDLELIYALVKENRYPSRSSAIRAGIREILRKEHKFP